MKVLRTDHKITAIGGVVTRSALEARWAIFFTLMCLQWKYEPTSFRLCDGHTYTPDFKVENLGWVEIKPTIGHLRESARKIKQFISEPACSEDVYAICSERPMLRYGEIVLFSKGKIYLPTEIQMSAKLTKASDSHATEINHDAITSALQAANVSKLDHMVSVADQFKMNRDRGREATPVSRLTTEPTL